MINFTKKSVVGPSYRKPTKIITKPAIESNFAFNFMDLYRENNPNMTEEKTMREAVNPSSQPSKTIAIFILSPIFKNNSIMKLYINLF
ncbi:MAG: hypothetical protein HWN81_10680 [Candidatus Lokiarchaeota archaeon]|nr:hypothetical protein [Candidatus Lokiarchaeota archaeon]